MKLNRISKILSLIYSNLLGTMLLCVLGCSTQPVSKPSGIAGYRILKFADGGQLTLKESNVLELGAFLGTRNPRLFEVSMLVPSDLSQYVDKITVYPITEFSESDPSTSRTNGTFSRLAIHDLSVEARFRKIGDDPDNVVCEAMRSYLYDSILPQK